MRLLSQGFTTAASSFAGRVAPASSGAPGGAVRLEAVSLSWASSVASTVTIKLNYGLVTSGTGISTVDLAVADSSASNFVYINGLGLDATWWELSYPTTNAKGCVGLVFGL